MYIFEFLQCFYKEMFCVGITGGIGTGKTMVAKIFASFGIPVYNADDEAKNIVNTHLLVKENIINFLGEDSYKNGKYNTAFVAQKVFAEKTLLYRLNGIIHPTVLLHFEQWKQLHQQEAPYLIKEASILFESNSYKDLNLIIGISSPQEVRIERLKKYRHLSDEQIKQRMGNQLSEQEKLQRCDTIIYNQPNHLLIPQVWDCHQQILAKIK